LFALVSCSHPSQPQETERRYTLSGRIIALNAKSQTATVDGAAIPNFMEAMTMEYPIQSKAEFNSLHVGEKIQATVNVSDSGSYNLTNIKELR
jgi:Cu/Ag efflux protein CusF